MNRPTLEQIKITQALLLQQRQEVHNVRASADRWRRLGFPVSARSDEEVAYILERNADALDALISHAEATRNPVAEAFTAE